MCNLIHKQNGNILVLSVISTLSIMAFASVAVDVGCILTAKNHLQVGVDASALAAASGLVVNQAEAIQRGIVISNSNKILQHPLALQSNEIFFIDQKTVKVTARRSVDLFFARVFGLNSAEVSATATAELGNRDIMLIFDRSGSMDDDTSDPDVPQPITDTQNASNYFVDLIAGNPYVFDRVGLVSYSTYAQLTLPLGRNFSLIKNTIQAYEANGYTNIGQAVQYSNNHLIQNSQSRTLRTEILLSDGMANRPGLGMPTNPTAIQFALSNAQIAANNAIKIYTISLGNDTDWNLMEQIAAITGGKHYHAPTPADLDAIFNEIASRIPSILIG
jgi:hypothetical protein